MDQELKGLKSVLRSLVVSSPVQVDVRSLMRDYRSMVGEPLPLAKYGYKDPLTFLKERCDDCFLLQGSSSNPVLTLIVPDTLKHIDKFVQKQRLSSSNKSKEKRRSIPGEKFIDVNECLISNTFKSRLTIQKKVQPKSSDINTKYRAITKINVLSNSPTKVRENNTVKTSNLIAHLKMQDKENDQHLNKSADSSGSNENCTRSALHNFLKKRMPLYNSSQYVEEEKSSETSSKDEGSSKGDDDSGRQTSSSNSVTKASRLEELKSEIKKLILDHPEGVYCTELIRLYREKYGYELNFTQFGYTSIVSLVCGLDDAVCITRLDDMGDWLLLARARVGGGPVPGAGAGAPDVAARRRYVPHAKQRRAPATRADPDDALPGISYDPDVFPSDCMHFMDSIPGASLAEVETGAMLEVMVGEVYSPSHMWLLRLGEQHNIAMENIMDEMTVQMLTCVAGRRYYSHGGGRARVLAAGAARAGHYCSSVFEGDWHRSLIVRVLDSDTVKVRHVDFGTVESVSTQSLKPLRREWGNLPAQAIRARLAGVRPPAGGRRWPHAASAHLLQLVRDRRLVANVVAHDKEEDILEVFLIDTATDEDVDLSSEMIRSGHADARNDSALSTSECYLFPRFDAIETGATPNFGEIYGYLRDGIALDFVEDYRRHVPACLPPPSTSPPPSPPTPPPPPPPRPAGPPERRTRAGSFSLERAQRPACESPSRARSAHAIFGATPAAGPAPSAPLAPLAPPAVFAPFSGSRSRYPSVYPPLPPTFFPEAGLPAAYPGARRSRPAARGPSPPPPYAGPAVPARPAGGRVTLSAMECEIFRLLSRMDPSAAQWYMSAAIERAEAAAAHEPDRFWLPPGMGPPPGFERYSRGDPSY